MANHYFRFIVLISSVLSAVPALCQQSGKIETDRPDQTESPYIVPKKWFQSETGFNIEENRSGYKTYVHPTMLNKYGISNRFEVRLITTWTRFESPSDVPGITIVQGGLEPVVIGGKVALWEEKGARPKTSLLFHTSLAHAASKVYRQNRMAPELRLAMQHSLSDKIGLGYNIGAEWDGFTRGPSWFISLTSAIDFSEHWSAYAEIFNILKDGEHPLNNVDGGIAYTFSKNYKFDFSYGYGLNPHAYYGHYFALGFSFRVR
jgi:hypothetical protein